MKSEKSAGGRRVLNIILLLLNIACALWIFLSWQGEQSGRSTLDYYRDRGIDVSEFENTENDGPVRP